MQYLLHTAKHCYLRSDSISVHFGNNLLSGENDDFLILDDQVNGKIHWVKDGFSTVIFESERGQIKGIISGGESSVYLIIHDHINHIYCIYKAKGPFQPANVSEFLLH